MSTRKYRNIGTTSHVISKACGFVLIISAMAAPAWSSPHVPEMDPGLATSAMALLAGGLALITGRTRRN
jgi:hypothetical protein